MPVTSAAENTSPVKILLDLGVDVDNISTDEEYLKAVMNAINSLDPGDGRIEILQKEVIRVRNNVKKQKAVSFVNGKSDGKKGAGVGKKKSTRVGRSSQVSPEEISGDGDKSEEIEKLKSVLVPGFTKIEGHLQSILDTFKDEAKLDKKQDRKDDIIAEKSAKKRREAELEGKPKIVDKALKALKPAKGLFDMIGGFVTNVLMGAALLGLVNLFQNIQKILKPIIEVVNGVVGYLNQCLEVLFGPLLEPINALISGLNEGFSLIFGAINKVLGWFKQEPLEPWKIGRFEMPQIPTIPVP